MSWTEERIDRLKAMWTKGATASQIAEELGGVSRNAVIGKAHRLGLQSRPSPVRGGDSSNSSSDSTPKQAAPAPVATPAPAAPAAPASQQVFRSIGPGGFQRQSPGEQQPPSTPAPPR